MRRALTAPDARQARRIARLFKPVCHATSKLHTNAPGAIQGRFLCALEHTEECIRGTEGEATIAKTSMICGRIWLKLQPTIPVTADSTPFQAAVSGLPTAKMPTTRLTEVRLGRHYPSG